MEWQSKGLHVIDENGRQIGQSYIMNFGHDARGKRISDTKGEANAKLMAAAPEMLDALQRILNKVYCNEISLPVVVCEEINSIIKKATE